MQIAKIDNRASPTLRNAGQVAPKRRRPQWQRPHRILFVLPDVSLVEPLMHDLVRFLDPRRFEPAICVLAHGDIESPSVTTDCAFLNLRVPTPFSGPRLLRSALALAYELRARGIDVVHAFRGPAEVVARLASRLPRVRPAVVATHDSKLPLESRALQALGRWTRAWSDRCVVPSLELRDFLMHEEGVPANCIAVIADGSAGSWIEDVGSQRTRMVREHSHLYATLATARRRVLSSRRPRRSKSLVELERELWG
jgi:hypothetical protein